MLENVTEEEVRVAVEISELLAVATSTAPETGLLPTTLYYANIIVEQVSSLEIVCLGILYDLTLICTVK